MAVPLETRSDCARCAALCCIAYPSQDMPGFTAAKEAGQPCPKLGDDARCTIYADRAEQGFAGCIRFECFGAGQHVVQHLFGGRDWRDNPALRGPMVETFLAIRPVSDLAFLVERALGLAPSPESVTELERLRDELQAIASTRESLSDGPRIAQAEAAIRRVYASIDPTKLRET
ncbi:hypothetical protein N6L26_05935 [Qipengyuania sp. SS22]|uniref:hypothetical protein n=1 Tax=Qipengyuania sp. SS22 TaxID=2979461 RepID=UPI0021E588F7|nr:hypothetical protein [Qipengyuania sp. SS22]UYH56090.1 hypothetical protein N6L26_05935 [Qipengyuania sp. SS22]